MSFLPLILTTGLHLGGLHTPESVPLLEHASSSLPPSSDWLRQFQPNHYWYKYPSNLVPVILPAYTTYEGGTVCSKMSACKIQTPGNHPKERIQHSEHDQSLKSKTSNMFYLHYIPDSQLCAPI